MAGRQDFVFPPECQELLAAGIPNSRLHLVDRAGHNPDYEQRAEVMSAVRQFIAQVAAAGPAAKEIPLAA
jgi:proline iminopeptidase